MSKYDFIYLIGFFFIIYRSAGHSWRERVHDRPGPRGFALLMYFWFLNPRLAWNRL